VLDCASEVSLSTFGEAEGEVSKALELGAGDGEVSKALELGAGEGVTLDVIPDGGISSFNASGLKAAVAIAAMSPQTINATGTTVSKPQNYCVGTSRKH
jgi:hypothetical protein